MQTIFDGVADVPQILAGVDAFIADHPIVSAITAMIGIALLGLGYLAVRAALRAGKRLPSLLISRLSPRPSEDTLTVIAAGIATAVSASGMWQFFERIMPAVPWYWRVAMFAFIEVAVITSAVRAKRSMKEKYSAGVDGMAVWALTSLSAVLSAMEAASVPEALFRLAAPLVAAWLWERGMAIERHRLTGLAGIHWRITPERILVRVGLAEAQDRTADEVDAHRRLTRVALAAKRVHQLRQANASDRKLRAAFTRRDRALDQAVEHTDLARNKATQATLLDIVTTLGGGDSITALLETAAAPWADLDHPALRQDDEPAETRQEARAAIAAYEDWKRPKIVPFVLTPPPALAQQDMTGSVSSNGRPANGHAHIVTAPATIVLPTPPVSDPVSDLRPEKWPLKDDDARTITHTNADTEPLTDTGSDSDQTREHDDEEPDDRGRPNDQDNQVAEEWIRRRCRGTNGVGRRPSWSDVATRYGFSVGWGGKRVKAVQERMTVQGYRFADDGTVLAPPKSRTESLTAEHGSGDHDASAEASAKEQLLHDLGLPVDEPGPYVVNGSVPTTN
ncbi:hypothetical protein [Streptosporangium roseum]|uniref:hypothetical protein n=1 Tax=Streptosporangium roseum TaxID=2001 RepID=UPI00069164D2|nr:hypothetical protein [Streptosporangium roseum]